MDEVLTAVERLTRDLRTASLSLSDDEARFLVDQYYVMQDARIRSDGQIRSMSEEPHEVLAWFSKQNSTLENQIKGAPARYVDGHMMGPWLTSIVGIGPVIAAGILAHIDITKCETAGSIWRYAGLDPTSEWKKGEKRPWNASLKTLLAFKAGESFVKTCNHKDSYYGKLYADYKKGLQEKNERGEFAAMAAACLEKKKYSKTTDAYKAYASGKLPPAHIHARARRWAVKLFVAHLFEVWYEKHNGKTAPSPYPIAILGHAHRYEAPTN